MKTIYEQLKEYSRSDYCGFHMPGHKRNHKIVNAQLPFDIDITEIEGFDDLHHAEGMIKQAEERAARLYHAQETHFLVNGSTCGILSAIMGCTKKGSKIIVARNCHKSVYHAIFMQELMPIYIYPQYEPALQLNGELPLNDIERILKNHNDITAMVVVSPTYDGVLSDIKAMAKLLHDHGIPLIVDEAHGAHLGFNPVFHDNANQQGADVVIHSTHKTLPALTQTALLHMNGSLVDKTRIGKYLKMFQSSSPSYVLMASIDACMDWIEKESSEVFSTYIKALEKLRKSSEQWCFLKLLETSRYDITKMVISTAGTNITGKQLYDILLKEFHIQVEMCTSSYVIAMMSPGDTIESLEKFEKILYFIDQRLVKQKFESHMQRTIKAKVIYTSFEVDHKEISYLKYEECVGKISMEYAYLYPPGIPILVPGEEITMEILEYLQYYKQMGFTMEGLSVENRIGVWING